MQETKISKQEIEYESVTIKIPKQLMKFLRSYAILSDKTVEQEIEYDLVSKIHSMIENIDGEELIDALGAKSIFTEILGNETFKPKN